MTFWATQLKQLNVNQANLAKPKMIINVYLEEVAFHVTQNITKYMYHTKRE
jgi:hypothetical protein